MLGHIEKVITILSQETTTSKLDHLPELPTLLKILEYFGYQYTSTDSITAPKLADIIRIVKSVEYENTGIDSEENIHNLRIVLDRELENLQNTKDYGWLSSLLYDLIVEYYANYKSRKELGGRVEEPSITAWSMWEDIAMRARPPWYSNLTDKQQQSLVRRLLEKLVVQGKLEASYGVGIRGEEVRMYNPK